MAARIKSIFKAETFVVNLEDDRDGEQVAIVAHVPFLNRALVVAVAKVADMKSGQGTIKGLSSGLEKEFLQRIAPKDEAAAEKPSKGRGKKG